MGCKRILMDLMDFKPIYQLVILTSQAITPRRCTFLTALQIWFRPPGARAVVHADAATTSPDLKGHGREPAWKHSSQKKMLIQVAFISSIPIMPIM